MFVLRKLCVKPGTITRAEVIRDYSALAAVVVVIWYHNLTTGLMLGLILAIVEALVHFHLWNKRRMKVNTEAKEAMAVEEQLRKAFPSPLKY